jgi:hypothetical protein
VRLARLLRREVHADDGSQEQPCDEAWWDVAPGVAFGHRTLQQVHESPEHRLTARRTAVGLARQATVPPQQGMPVGVGRRRVGQAVQQSGGSLDAAPVGQLTGVKEREKGFSYGARGSAQ